MSNLKQLSNLILFNQEGKIIYMSGEAYGDVDRPAITSIDFIEVPYGSVDYNKNIIVSVDVRTKQPVIQKLDIKPTEEELRMQELEKQNADLAYKLMIGEM